MKKKNALAKLKDVAYKACRVIGIGLYGVDIKKSCWGLNCGGGQR